MIKSRPVAVIAALTAAGAGLLLTLYPGLRSASAKYNLLLLNQIAGLREADLAFALHSAGLTPESLAASGIDADHATAVVAAAATHMGGDVEAVAAAQTHLGQARTDVERLERLVRRGAGLHEQGPLSAARAELADAQGDFDSVIAALRATALAPLSAPERARLDALRPNLDRPVPPEFKLAERTDEEWVRLRDALANEHQASAGLTEADPACASLLQTARADHDAAAAHTALADNLATVNEAYHGAVATLGE